ncbi:hypothetical protein KY290_008607 [Solanum tuberosum]|uniref:Uncharacterized protein n=1 Tax=Solanum tuberosum TaxID=4113 RepID=A0ABQ7WA91_SOLTU|nr:hypothetical protein KY290_008607 [Solanum tuberosum]
MKKYRDAETPPNRKAIAMYLRAFSIQQLHEATNCIKNKLGQGASGGVYRGILKLEDEEVEVAVKKLGNGIEQGFCNEKSNRLVVYELLKNGAVSNLIFCDGQRPS